MLSGGLLGCPETPTAVIESWATGWYLFAIDEPMGEDGCAGVGYYTLADFPPWQVVAITARSQPLGPVLGPPAPTVQILRTALIRHRRLLVARVSCASPCTVRVDVSDGQTGADSDSRIVGTHEVGVPRGQLANGKLLLTIYVDHARRVLGQSSLR